MSSAFETESKQCIDEKVSLNSSSIMSQALSGRKQYSLSDSKRSSNQINRASSYFENKGQRELEEAQKALTLLQKEN